MSTYIGLFLGILINSYWYGNLQWRNEVRLFCWLTYYDRNSRTRYFLFVNCRWKQYTMEGICRWYVGTETERYLLSRNQYMKRRTQPCRIWFQTKDDVMMELDRIWYVRRVQIEKLKPRIIITRGGAWPIILNKGQDSGGLRHEQNLYNTPPETLMYFGSKVHNHHHHHKHRVNTQYVQLASLISKCIVASVLLAIAHKPICIRLHHEDYDVIVFAFNRGYYLNPYFIPHSMR